MIRSTPARNAGRDIATSATFATEPPGERSAGGSNVSIVAKSQMSQPRFP